MKKLFLAIALIAVTATTVMAQNTTRDQKRAARQTAYEAKMKAAVTAQDFYFIPYQFTAPYQSPVQLATSLNYVEVYPGDLSLILPFSVGTPNPVPNIRNLNLVSVPYTYSSKALDNNHYVVMMRLTNVSDTRVGPNMSLQNINLTLHFYISASNGQTTLTVTPDFGPASSYWGTTTAN